MQRKRDSEFLRGGRKLLDGWSWQILSLPLSKDEIFICYDGFIIWLLRVDTGKLGVRPRQQTTV